MEGRSIEAPFRSVWALVGCAILVGALAGMDVAVAQAQVPEGWFVLRDGSTIRGWLVGERLRVRLEGGVRDVQAADVKLMHRGQILLVDGSELKGEVQDEALLVRVSGTTTGWATPGTVITVPRAGLRGYAATEELYRRIDREERSALGLEEAQKGSQTEEGIARRLERLRAVAREYPDTEAGAKAKDAAERLARELESRVRERAPRQALAEADAFRVQRKEDLKTQIEKYEAVVKHHRGSSAAQQSERKLESLRADYKKRYDELAQARERSRKEVYSQAVQDEQNGRFAEAIAKLDALLELDPRNQDAFSRKTRLQALLAEKKKEERVASLFKGQSCLAFVEYRLPPGQESFFEDRCKDLAFTFLIYREGAKASADYRRTGSKVAREEMEAKDRLAQQQLTRLRGQIGDNAIKVLAERLGTKSAMWVEDPSDKRRDRNFGAFVQERLP